MPESERECKDTRDGINRPRYLAKLRSLSETAKFPIERRLRVSAKYLIRRSGISPPSRLVTRSAPAPRERKEVYHKSAQLWEMKVCECESLKVGGAVTYHGSPANPLYLINR